MRSVRYLQPDGSIHYWYHSSKPGQWQKGPDEKTTYVYDEKNNVIKKTYYNEKDEIQRSFNFEYEYDNNDNWTKRVAFILDKPGAISIREYEYYWFF